MLIMRHKDVKSDIREKKDWEIIKDVLKAYGTVNVDATSYQHPEMVQYYCSDWDFALSRADANGLFIYTRGKEINVFKPKVSGKPVLTVTNGVDLIDFDGGLSGSEQYGKYEAVSWDPATQNQVRQTASAPTLNEQGDITIKNWQEMIVKYCKLMPLSTRTP